MAKIFICPNKYVQGAGEMEKIADYAKAYGKKALVIITASGYKRIGETIHNTPFEVTAEKVVATMKAADAYGRYLRAL